MYNFKTKLVWNMFGGVTSLYGTSFPPYVTLSQVYSLQCSDVNKRLHPFQEWRRSGSCIVWKKNVKKKKKNVKKEIVEDEKNEAKKLILFGLVQEI